MKIQKRKSAQIVSPLATQSQINETDLFSRVAKIIETRKFRAAVRANCEVTLTPRGFNIKAQGCAYPRYPGLGCVMNANPNGVAHHHFNNTTHK